MGFPPAPASAPYEIEAPLGSGAGVVNPLAAGEYLQAQRSGKRVIKVHFIGIGGTGMAALAAMLKRKGVDVRGSDHAIYPPMSDFLAEQEIPVLDGYHAEHIASELDLVIVGNAVSRGNPEVEEVLDRKIRYCSLPEAVRDHFLWGARSIVVAGTHGKTSTASLVGWLLAHGGLDPSLMVGGIARNFGASFRLGGGRDFVIEGDEYDSAFFDKTAKFLKYLPNIVVINNVEFDHADIYTDLDGVRLAFRRLVNLIPRRGLLLLGADSPEAIGLRAIARCRVETFGLAEGADWQAQDLVVTPAGTTFHIHRGGVPFARADVPLLGAYNVRNVLAAVAVGTAAGLMPVGLTEGLKQFQGVQRRLDLRGTVGGVSIYDDFAHHPTAVEETLRAVPGGASGPPDLGHLRTEVGDRVPESVPEGESLRLSRWAMRSWSARCFGRTLADAERLSESQVVSDVKAAGTPARHIPKVEEIVATVVREGQEGDLVVVMSNGDFGGIHDRLLQALRERSA